MVNTKIKFKRLVFHLSGAINGWGRCWASTLVGTSNDTPCLELPLASSSPLLLFLRLWGKAIRAGDSVFPKRGLHVSIAHGLFAAIAELKGALGQSMLHWYPLVKHKALPLPQALRLGNFLQVFQYPTFQVINLQRADNTFVTVRTIILLVSELYL